MNIDEAVAEVKKQKEKQEKTKLETEGENLDNMLDDMEKEDTPEPEKITPAFHEQHNKFYF